MSYSKDIEVEMTFLRTDEGGCQSPRSSGYRPQFYYNEHDWDAIYTYIDTDLVYPGQTVRAYLSFLSPDAHLGKVYPGMDFSIRAGSRTVAYGIVVKIIELEQSAKRVRKSK